MNGDGPEAGLVKVLVSKGVPVQQWEVWTRELQAEEFASLHLPFSWSMALMFPLGNHPSELGQQV